MTTGVLARLQGVLGALIVASMLGGTASGQEESAEGYRVGELAPIIEVNDLDGEPVDLGEYLGKVPVYLEFWATWCERCEALLPHVREMAIAYGDRVQFVGINVAVNQSPARVRRYISEHDPPFRPLYDNLGTSVRAFHVPTTSYVVIVDRDRVIRYVGVGGDQDFEAVLTAVTTPAEAQP